MASNAVETIEARCLSCGYQLRDLPEPRCPECGRQFDPGDPATIWLPTRLNALMRWLIQPPRSRIGRMIPLIAVLFAAWGSRMPTWDGFFLQAAFYLLKCGIIGACVSIPMEFFLRWRGYDVAEISKRLARWHKHLFWAVAAVLLLTLLHPTMFISFWVSRPMMDQTARRVLAQPFAETPQEHGIRGLYYVSGVRRCPHGVKVCVSSGWECLDTDPGFFYRDKPGSCSRFELGIPLGGGWYISPGDMVAHTLSEIGCEFSSLAGPD